jgi:GT2 family glycosyltransferase
MSSLPTLSVPADGETLTTSVIIPVWNGRQDLPACLDALLAQTPAPGEIIAVDNASTDGSADLIAAGYPQVILIRNATNLGFGGACNVGMAQARGDILVLLNQDTEVLPGWLAALIAAFQADPSVGIAGSKARYPDGRIQHAGGTVDAQGSGFHRGHGAVDDSPSNQIEDVDYVSGASLALRHAAYTQLGGFDPAFKPAYFEDVDLCMQARALGWRVVYVPDSVLVHQERSVAATPSHDGMFRFHRNRLRVVCKHWSSQRLREEFLPAERAWIAGLDAGGERLVIALHQAYLTHLLNLGELAQWRQQLLNEPAATIDTVAEVLLELRTLHPLPGVAGTRHEDGIQRALGEAEPLAYIRARPFHSAVPVAGPWIAAFRQAWNRVATEWYVQPMIADQSHFNAALLDALRQTLAQQSGDRRDQAAHSAMLLEYITGLSREIGVLSQEVATLKRQLESQQDAQQEENG